jgi:hypothetical protein
MQDIVLTTLAPLYAYPRFSQQSVFILTYWVFA